MTHYSSYMTDEKMELLLGEVEGAQYLSKRDGCPVILVKCTKCNNSFEEELQSAIKCVKEERDFLCLSCDPAGENPAFVGLTIQLGWEAE